MELITHLWHVTLGTFKDVLPIVVIIFGFHYIIIRKAIPNLKRTLIGFLYVVVGLALFLVGLDMALFPLGETMAKQLTNPLFIYGSLEAVPDVFAWQDYTWVYLFAFFIGLSTTIAEPSLMAVAIKAENISAGTISAWGLRIAVAVGVAIGISLGTFRIIIGTPLPYFIIAGYVLVVIQTVFAPKFIVPLAFDSGGVTTSTVTVPLVAALGLGLASTVPGRSPLIDGFGLIAFASLFPMMTVMGYAMIAEWKAKKVRNGTNA